MTHGRTHALAGNAASDIGKDSGMSTHINEIGPHSAEALYLLLGRVSAGDLDTSREIEIESDDGEVAVLWRPDGLVKSARNVVTPLSESECNELGLPVGSTYGDMAALIGTKLGLTSE
jgi:hypothetical protein